MARYTEDEYILDMMRKWEESKTTRGCTYEPFRASSIMKGTSLTDFRMADGSTIKISTEESYIEVDGLRIPMRILQDVAKKINEEKENEPPF